MAAVYATRAELAAFLGVDAPAQAERLLRRASELVEDTVIVGWEVDDNGQPAEPGVVEAFRNAVCAQVEFWLEVGEEHDVTNQRGTIGVGDLNVSTLPGTLSHRAARHLRRAGLGSRAVTTGFVDHRPFFGDNSI